MGVLTLAVSLSLAGLDDLGADARYEGWLIVDGENNEKQ